MKLRAIATPTDAPIPAVPPSPMAALAAMTLAFIVELLLESISRLPAVIIRLPSSTKAFVRLRMMFLATAPAPLTAIPAMPPPPIANDAAKVRLSILETVFASMTTSPLLDSSLPSTARMNAST